MARRQSYDEVCTFCGRDRDQVERLIAGPPDVHICSECVELCNSILMQERTRRSERRFSLTRMPAPREIKEELDRYVIGQERAKKILAVAVYGHYQRIQHGGSFGEVELEKSNILLVGPTGCGKTLLARTLARFLKVPFAIGDATTLTEAGYVGEDVENLLLRLIQAADGDIASAERGIIYIDELDKLGRKSENPSITRDVSGEGVQQALLKILEGTVANVPPQGGRKHPEQRYIPINTAQILFIGGGTFEGVEDIVANRVGKKTIGFRSEGPYDRERDQAELLDRIEPADVLRFGLIPELIGRLPVICPVHPLDEKALVQILTEPKNAVIRQYQTSFEMEGSKLEFPPAALSWVAEQATEKKTGARALRAILERSMLELFYTLPGRETPGRYVVTAEALAAGTVAAIEPEPLPVEEKRAEPRPKRRRPVGRKTRRRPGRAAGAGGLRC